MKRTHLIIVLAGALFSLFMMHVPTFAQGTINPTWDVHWYVMSSPGDFTQQEIGESSFPLNFSYDWGYGTVYAGYEDYIGFKAYLNIYVPVSKEFYFEIGADDGAALYIDGEQVLKLWSRYTLFRGYNKTCWYELSAGWHRLELWFFEWTGKASILFKISDIKEWKSQLIWKNLQDLQTKIDALEAKERSLQDEVETLGPQTSSLIGQISDLQEEIGTLKGAITALTGTVTPLSKDVAALKSMVTTLTNLSAEEKVIEDQQAALSQEIMALKEEMAANSAWEVNWYEMTAPGVFGKGIGTSSLPLNFSYNWGYGRIYKMWNHVGLKAHTKIYVPFDSFCYFNVSASNSFILYIDGKKALEHWEAGKALPPAAKSGKYVLTAGWHELELYYYAWEGEAWLNFHSW